MHLQKACDATAGTLNQPIKCTKQPNRCPDYCVGPQLTKSIVSAERCQHRHLHTATCTCNDSPGTTQTPSCIDSNSDGPVRCRQYWVQQLLHAPGCVGGVAAEDVCGPAHSLSVGQMASADSYSWRQLLTARLHAQLAASVEKQPWHLTQPRTCAGRLHATGYKFVRRSALEQYTRTGCLLQLHIIAANTNS